MMEIDTIPLNSVRINGGTQSRVELNQATIGEYAEAIRLSTELPPVVVFFDGVHFWLADGFHRFHAHREAGALEITADIRTGTQRDAVLYSVGANAAHGLRRSNDDKRKAVITLLNDPEWSSWSDREIARVCGVSHTFVANLRKPEVATVATPQPAQVATVATPAAAKPAQTAAASAAPLPDATPPNTPVEEVAIAVSVELAVQVQELRDQVAELADSLKSTLADNEMMGRVFDADDRLKAAVDEAARQKAIADNAERTLIAKSGEFVERARAVTYWKNRAEKAEKRLATLEKAV